MIVSLPKLIASLRLSRHKYSRDAGLGRFLLLVSVGLALLVGLGAPRTARAALSVVTNLNDSGAGSLRQTIADAAPGDTITFAVTGTIILTSGELVVNKDLTISGPGAASLSISGNQINIALASRVFNNSAHLTITGLTIRDGEAGPGEGGGILNAGTGMLTITNSVLTANRAQRGGGIFNSAGGQLQVTNSTFFANSTRLVDVGADASGAGIYNAGPGGVVSINDSTFSTNNVHDNGSGLYNDATATAANSTFTLSQAGTAAVYNNSGTLQLINVTITLNNGRKQATGLLSNGGSVSVGNSIVAANTTSGNFSLPDCGGPLTSEGHNLIGNATGCNISAGTGDQLGSDVAPIDPKLGPLTINGGPTMTHALLLGSPAIDAGSNSLATNAGLTTDQRGTGFPRLVNNTVDIGAVEMSFANANRVLIALSNANYSVNESTGFVTITVARSGDLSVPVTVNYATDDTGSSGVCGTLNSGMASARCDFGLALGTLKFAATETQKSFVIPITQDSITEGPEMFTVNLSNLTGSGAAFATPSSATVTINDSASPASNASDDADAFVRQQYRDFLNRDADPAGLNFWTHEITSCGTDPACIELKRINVSAAFFLSIEFQLTGNLVRSFYVAALNRPATNNMPAFVEFERDTQFMQRGVTVDPNNNAWQTVLNNNRDAFMNDFVTRAEFVGLYPTTDSPAQYVDKLYLHAGVTPATPAERQAAIDEFIGTTNPSLAADAGARGRALLRVTQNTAFQQREINRSFVQMQYFGYLRRNPNDAPDGNFAGYDFWLGKLNLFNGNFVNAEMVKAFILSGEYRNRFGP